jgi:hypothetical protein
MEKLDQIILMLCESHKHITILEKLDISKYRMDMHLKEMRNSGVYLGHLKFMPVHKDWILENFEMYVEYKHRQELLEEEYRSTLKHLRVER